MSLREKLREQAASVEDRRAEDQRAATENQRFYEAEILPALQRAADYFDSVVADLETIKHTTLADFPLGPPTAPAVQFTQSNYRLYVDDSRTPREVAVTCNCELPTPMTRRIAVLKDADEFEQRLRGMGMQHHRQREHDLSHGQSESSRFSFEGEIRSGFRLRADIERQRITLETRNLEDIPTVVHPLPPERVDEELLEMLGLLLLRERRFLFKGDMSAEDRERLTEAVRRQHAERDKLLAEAEAESADASVRRLLRPLSALKEAAARKKSKD